MRVIQVDFRWAVTVLVALYGALLSTYNAYVARKQSRHQIDVKITFGWLTYGPNLSDDMVMVGASNPGHRAVTLTSVGFLLPDGRQLALMTEGSKPLPHHLSEGTSIQHWIPQHELIETLRKQRFSGPVKLRGFYNDAVGATHLSKPVSFKLS
jgi:hypothetical protein